MDILLVVDVQNDFCPGGSLAVAGGDEIVPTINALLATPQFSARIATLDWHPANHTSFHTLWPVHCVQGTHGAAFHPRLDVRLLDRTIVKGTDPAVDSYSGFFDNERQRETELRSIIDSLASSHGEHATHVHLHIVGLALDYCVKATALDAKALGYEVSVVVDATRAVNLHHGDDLRTLRELAAHGIALSTSRELLAGRGRGVELQRE